MIEVRIYECEPFQPAREFAVVTVDGNGVSITATDPFAQRVKEIRLIDPETDEQLTAESNPERWARLLPTAYRTPVHARDRHPRRAAVTRTQPGVALSP